MEPDQPLTERQAFSAPWPSSGAMPGKTRSVAAVVILFLVTFGIYGLVWGWKVTRELDVFARPAKPAHPRYRTSIFFLLGALAPILVGASIIAATVGLAKLAENPQDVAVGAVGSLAVGGLFVVAGAALLVTALVYYLMSIYQFTRTLEEEGRRRGASDGANATLLFVLFLLGSLSGRYGGQLLTVIAAGLSQNALNKLWTTRSAPPQGASPVPGPGSPAAH